MRYLNTAEMQELERFASEKYHISLEQMMQNAGKAVFDVVMGEVLPQIQSTIPSECDNDHCRPQGLRLLVICGKGNNGGDALVTARLLHEKGIDVTVFNVYSPEEMSPMAKTEFKKCRKAGVRFVGSAAADDNNYSLIIDGIFGFSLKNNPRLPEARIIEQINCSFLGSARNDNLFEYHHIPILSVDVPSGLNVSDGSLGTPTVKADYTISLGMAKKGFEKHPEIIGKLYIGDLGIPPQAFRDMGYEPPMFGDKTYVSVN